MANKEYGGIGGEWNEKRDGRVISNTLLLSEIDEWKSKLRIFYSKLMLLLQFYIRYSHKCVVIGWGCWGTIFITCHMSQFHLPTYQKILI